MEDKLMAQALAAAKEIVDLDEDQLYAELEIRRRMLADDPRVAGSFDVVGEERASFPASGAALSRMGRKFFTRLSGDLYEIVCTNSKDATDIRTRIAALITDEVSVTAFLATCAVTHLGIAPALATVLALLVSKLILKNAKETICDEWKATLSLS